MVRPLVGTVQLLLILTDDEIGLVLRKIPARTMMRFSLVCRQISTLCKEYAEILLEEMCSAVQNRYTICVAAPSICVLARLCGRRVKVPTDFYKSVHKTLRALKRRERIPHFGT